MKKILVLILTLLMILSFAGCKSDNYEKGVELYEKGDYHSALEVFEKISGYKDSKKYIDDINIKLETDNIYESLNNTIGDILPNKSTFFFGKYEQDNNTSNGMEDIEWFVLDTRSSATRDGRVLLVSKYVLDCKPYNNSLNNYDWRTSSLRIWLNNEFYNMAFSEAEKSVIHTNVSEVRATTSNDKVFCLDSYEYRDELLLSDYEGERFFPGRPTKFAIAQGAKQGVTIVNSLKKTYTNDGCYFWLRDATSDMGAPVGGLQPLNMIPSKTINSTDVGVRPVICITYPEVNN